MPFEVNYNVPVSELSWLVNQFETIEFDGSSVFADTFVPRNDAALVFHFGEAPSIIEPVQVKMPIFFVAPVLRTSLTLELKINCRLLLLFVKHQYFIYYNQRRQSQKKPKG